MHPRLSALVIGRRGVMAHVSGTRSESADCIRVKLHRKISVLRSQSLGKIDSRYCALKKPVIFKLSMRAQLSSMLVGNKPGRRPSRPA